MQPEPRILQLCHGYDGPFMDCARQYAVLFDNTPYKVTTVYLTGAPSEAVRVGSASDEVIFLNQSSSDIRGLKLSAIRAVRRIAAQRNFHLCLAHRFKPIYVALLATSLPVIGIHHAFGGYKRLGRRLFVSLFRRRLVLLGVSDAVRDDVRRRLPGWPAEQILTLYNRLDVAVCQSRLFSREEARQRLSLPVNAWIVATVGRLHPDKDPQTLLKAFALALPQLPSDSLLVIMGSGRLERELKQLAQALGIGSQVIFTGQVAEGRRYFRAFDVFALPSDHEPFGMVLLEAMAADVPVIATDCGGAREIVAGAGRLFPLGDVAQLAQQLVEMAAGDPVPQIEAQMRRLQDCFTDICAKQKFFELPGVNSHLTLL